MYVHLKPKNFIDVTSIKHDGKYIVNCRPLVYFGAIEDIHSDFFHNLLFFLFSFLFIRHC